MDIRNNSDRRVVITGLGPVSPVGIGVEPFWESVKHGKSNYRRISRFSTENAKTNIAAEIDVFVPKLKGGEFSSPPDNFTGLNVGEYVHPKTFRKIERFGIKSGGWSLYYAIAAAKLAVQDAKLDLDSEDKERVGVTISAASGDAQLSRLGPPVFDITQYGALGGLVGSIAFEFGLHGTGIPTAGACASGGISLRAGYLEIMSGAQEVMLTGSTSAALASPLLFEAYDEPRFGGPMSTENDLARPMKPFDINRKGFALSEGAGVIVLEELEHAKARGAKIYAEVLGFGHSTDTAEHFADVSIGGYTRAMTQSLNNCGLTLDEINNSKVYLNSHGTATKKNDLIEAQAIQSVFGDLAESLMINSIKGTTGHAQEAASSHELISCALSLEKGIIPPTTGLETLDPECGNLNFIRDKFHETNIDYVFKNASGFCGPYVTTVLKKYSE